MADVGHCHTTTHYHVSETEFLGCLQIGVVTLTAVKVLPAHLECDVALETSQRFTLGNDELAPTRLFVRIAELHLFDGRIEEE